MGTRCTKQESTESINLGRELSCQSEDTDSVVDDNELDDLVPAVTAPGHTILREKISHISSNFKFYINIKGFKARALALKNRDAHVYLTIDWDCGYYEQKTDSIKQGTSPKWSESFEFHWEISSMDLLKEKKLIVRIWEEELKKPVVESFTTSLRSRVRLPQSPTEILVGEVVLDLLTIASGPVHHDLSLHEGSEDNRERRTQSTAGLGFHNSSTLNEITINSFASSNHLNFDIKDQALFAGKRGAYDHGRVLFNVRMMEICNLIITPVEILTHLEKDVELNSLTTAFPPPLPPSELMLAKDNQTSSPSPPAPLSVRPEKQRNEYEDTPEEEDDVDETEREMHRAAAGGHAEEDDKVVPDACWLMLFQPSGVESQTGYASSWTSLCREPNWNALNMNVVNEKFHEKLPAIPERFVSESNIRRQKLQFPSSYSPQYVSRTHSTRDKIPDSSKLAAYFSTRHLTTKPRSSSEFFQASDLSSMKSSDTSSLTRMSQSSTSIYLSKSLEEIQPSSLCPGPGRNGDLFEIHHKLAALGREGYLVSDYLIEGILPTLQLETTNEHLRQNNLKLQLYFARFGQAESRLCGEAWVPFSKIYDADVVNTEQVNFYDGYFLEKLWINGKCVGLIGGLIVFQHNPSVRQMLAGVHTDAGIRKSMPPIIGSEVKQLPKLKVSRNVLPRQLVQLMDHHQQLLSGLFLRSKHSKQEMYVAPGTERNELILSRMTADIPTLQDMEKICESIIRLLKSSQAESRNAYLYEDDAALFTAQRVFLDLADHVVDDAKYQPFKLRSLYESILLHVLRRSELDFASSGLPVASSLAALAPREQLFCYVSLKAIDADALKLKSQKLYSNIRNEQRSKNFRRKKPPHSTSLIEIEAPHFQDISYEKRIFLRKNLVDNASAQTKEHFHLNHQKMKMARQIYLLLYRKLASSLEPFINPEDHSQPLRNSGFLATAYFRVPKFRKEIMRHVLTENDREVEILEWRGTNFDLSASSLEKLEEWDEVSKEYSLLLNWDFFHHQVESYFGLESLSTQFSYPGGFPSEGVAQLCTRKSVFFSFLEHWAKLVYHTYGRDAVSGPKKTPNLDLGTEEGAFEAENVQWHLIPGYATFVKALLLHMKEALVSQYSDSLLNCSGALLANNKLVSVFMKICFMKTSVYATHCVFSSLNYMDYWLQVLTLRKKEFPSDLHSTARGNWRSGVLPVNFDYVFLTKSIV
eukprot:GHVP01055578.1.p1 GENE.GHVP01055578.1~~GHVP01055578.1.p1  ORF type:complete len:1209 (+),score=229.30 GHVP01055578.1:119-3745(+)